MNKMQVSNEIQVDLQISECTLLTSMEYAEKIKSEIEALQKQLEAIGGKQSQLNELEAKRNALKNDLADVEKQIRALEKDLGATSSRSSAKRASGGVRRPRLSSSDVSAKILGYLQQNSGGVSQRQISEGTGVSYPAVIKFLKDNASKFRTEGSRRTSRVFLQ